MHDSHQIDALLSASVGSKVGVFAKTLTEVQAICISMADYLEGHDQATVRKVNGQHEINFPNGGTIRFISFRQSARGFAFDRVYVPMGVPANVLEDLMPTLATGDDGLVTGYL